MPNSVTQNLANQLRSLAQIYSDFSPPTAQQLEQMGPADVIELSQSLPGHDAFSSRLKQSVLLLNMTRGSGKDVA